MVMVQLADKVHTNKLGEYILQHFTQVNYPYIAVKCSWYKLNGGDEYMHVCYTVNKNHFIKPLPLPPVLPSSAYAHNVC